MKRDFIYVSVAMLCLAGYAVAGFGGGQQNTQSLPIVFLQNSTPGTPQTGHTNISGTSRAGQFVGGGSGLTNVNADLLDGLNSTEFLQAVPNPLALSASTSSGVITGTNMSNTSGASGLRGLANGTGFVYGVRGEATSNNGAGVLGTGTITGVYATCTDPSGTSLVASGSGILGVDALGNLIGVRGTGGERGVIGNGGSSGIGVDGQTSTGQGVIGSSSNSTVGTGVKGESYASNGYAVYGENKSTSGGALGGYFTSPSVDARALFGVATASVGITYGTLGQSNSPTGGYGVWGLAQAAGWSVWAQGRLGASGTKSFCIDHPLDPENKYLLHYSSESPSPQNFYSGNVTTDANGKAWVTLPDYFAEVNTNFKYQLTVVDDNESDTFVQAKIGRKIQRNTFLVMTSAPHVEVSWRIEADRNDLWVREHGAPDVQEKNEYARGTYLHPELYGQPKEKGQFEARLSAQRAASKRP